VFTTNEYQTDRKRFSTSFKFDGHLTVGRHFGAEHDQELVAARGPANKSWFSRLFVASTVE